MHPTDGPAEEWFGDGTFFDTAWRSGLSGTASPESLVQSRRPAEPRWASTLTCSPTPSFFARLLFCPPSVAPALSPVSPVCFSSPPRERSRLEAVPCTDGYRFAKRQRESAIQECEKSANDGAFRDSPTAARRPAFRFHSSRCLNCPSNLTGHSHPNTPDNGGWGKR